MFGGNSVNHSFSFAADLSNGAVKKEASTKEVARIWINDIKMRSFSPTVVSGTNDSFAKPVCCWPQTVVASSRSCSYLSCVWWNCQVHLFVQKVSCSTRWNLVRWVKLTAVLSLHSKWQFQEITVLSRSCCGPRRVWLWLKVISTAFPLG